MESERNTHLRRILVATAEVAPTERPRPTRRVVAAGLAAFVLAGALTGGAVAVASAADPTVGNDLTNYATLALGTAGTLIGEPHTFTGPGRAELTIPPSPRDGDRLVIVTMCHANADLTLRLDDDVIVDGDCHGNGAAVRSVSRNSAHTVTAWAAGRYAVFASWFTDEPKPEASEQEEHDLSDGVVTREEYVAAYSRFAGCMAEAGAALPPIDLGTTSVFDAGSPDSSAVGLVAQERCLSREFGDVDRVWQVDHTR